MLFGSYLPSVPNISIVEGDIRDNQLVHSVLSGCTDVIHLAAIANDPCCDLNPRITCDVNKNAVIDLVEIAKNCGVRRFINASTGSVYGTKEEESVTEDLTLEPTTLYAKLKAETEEIVRSASNENFTTISIRSGTVFGLSPRMRFDLIINIMTKSAVVDGKIIVHGGKQYRSNVHIDDIANLCYSLLKIPSEQINRKIYNFSSTNHTAKEIADMVREETGAAIHIDTNITDNRSIRVSSEKIEYELGYKPKKTVRQGIREIKNAFEEGYFPNPDNNKYYNVRTMKEMCTK
jgi:nucleoside-diphosphate-sugar epimerase